MTLQESIGLKIKNLREINNLSQTELAHKVLFICSSEKRNKLSISFLSKSVSNNTNKADIWNIKYPKRNRLKALANENTFKLTTVIYKKEKSR